MIFYFSCYVFHSSLSNFALVFLLGYMYLHCTILDFLIGKNRANIINKKGGKRN